jgi:putative tryptophan/tyrosine transport system substrate-binding protein
MMIGRRRLIAGTGAFAAYPSVLSAQQPAKLPIIGFLTGGGSTAIANERNAATVQRLRELGWIEGRTIGFEYRWAEANFDRALEIANEFVRLKVDIIFTSSTPTTIAAKRATSTIPIVFVATADPVRSSLVASLAWPGGNATGISNQTSDLAGKRLGLLREVLPNLQRLAVLANPENVGAMLEFHEVQSAAGAMGVAVVPLEIRRGNDIPIIFSDLKADALYIVIDPLTTTQFIRINTLSISAKLPTMFGSKEFVEAAGFISYGADFKAIWQHGADYIDKILHGAKPADLPVEQPTKFELAINLTTAKVLGLTIPTALLARADEVIE